MKYLPCIRNRDNRQWRYNLYSKLRKIGLTQVPSDNLMGDGYIIISPRDTFYIKREIDAFEFDGYFIVEAKTEKEFYQLINKYLFVSMKTYLVTIEDAINGAKCPIPVSVIPNNMGINLTSVDSVCWTETKDGQLVSVTINFIPE